MRGIFIDKRCLSNILGNFFKFSLLPKKGKKTRKSSEGVKKIFWFFSFPKRMKKKKKNKLGNC
jgi:hypothetical protein